MIDCKKIAKKHKDELKSYIKTNNWTGALAVLQVGEDPASNSYIKGKRADCEEVGITFNHYQYDDNVTTDMLIDDIQELNNDPYIKGIIVQLPLPKHLDVDLILNSIVDEKDVDGFKHTSKFDPCTPKGVMMVLDHLKINVDGQICCVIGRGFVGKPMVELLTKRNATIFWCNSHTSPTKMRVLTGMSRVVVTATGQAGLIKYVNPGVAVIDVGISRGEDGKLYGDVDRSCYDEDKFITPVPGGVGLMTRVALLENVVHGCNS